MKPSLNLIISLVLFSSLAAAIYFINASEQDARPESWSSFIYTGDYGSGRYQKQDGFPNLETCRNYSNDKENNANSSPWECGLHCEFDSRRQGFECQTMEND